MYPDTLARPTNYPLTHQGVRDLNQPRLAVGRNPMPVNVGPGERAASTVAGGVLTALGLTRGGCAGLAMLWGGAALLLRGVTGYCGVNEAVGRNSAR